MQMLTECGQALVKEVKEGIYLAANDAVRLDAETREGFELPSPWPGGMRLQTEMVPHSSAFAARLGLIDSDPHAAVCWEWKLRGAILEVGHDHYLPTVAQYTALRAFAEWRDSGERDEPANLAMLASLREAHDAGCHIYLEAYAATQVVNARELKIDARLDPTSGDLILRPLITGEFPTLTADEFESRFGHLEGDSPRAVFRVGQTIVLLNPTQTLQARALANRRRVPKVCVDDFESNPSAWLAEHVFPDIETEFSPRVTGIDVWRPGYMGATWDEGEDWFGKMPEPAGGRAKSSGMEPGDNRGIGADDMQEPQPPDAPVVPVIRPNDAEVDFGRSSDQNNDGGEALDFKAYARSPLPHQIEAVEWLINNHAKRALFRRKQPATIDEEGNDAGKRPSRTGAGALLADDMGLGKTFTTLIFLREWLALWRRNFDETPPAVLIVAPLSLLENWRVEIAKSYRETNVFKRVLIAQSDSDLRQVMRRPGGRDRAVPGEVLEYGLGYGDGTERSIDMPGGCVLTTYQTLRDYRFSFAKAEWSAAVFDEAQNIKNPNAQQTIAAKSLKAVFWLALTGTPVENHLGDFWSILDTVEPGPHLGSFAEFRRNWIIRMAKDAERMTEIGEELRLHIDQLMLRRMKEKVLTGLPEKTGHNHAIPVAMKPEQVVRYDAVIASANEQYTLEEVGDGRHNSHLVALWKIRQISLHPDLMADGSIPNARSSVEARLVLSRSGKLEWLLFELDRIKELGEKVLVFCVQKKLQTALAQHLSLIYGDSVPVINGDTKTISSRQPDETRLGLIEDFSNRAGFAVCILSPIAAGAGLNIVAANHVIHLERHWNPAKEDQATDRVYRIGQAKPVKVYLPTSRHPNPERRAFDEILHGLIEKKRGLQGALGLVPYQSVSDRELVNEVFTSAAGDTQAKFMGLDEVINLPWRLFEALIAVLYRRNAERVILTPGGSDHGCDVVVFGWGENRENLLIQCKQTSSNKLDSEVAIREVEGARPFYENAFNVTFGRRCLHTTASRLSRRTRRAADLCRVSTHDRSWLASELKKNPVTLTEVLAQNARREKV